MTDRRCTWREDDEGNWDTSCDNLHILLDGGPAENGMRFCCYCGRPLVEEAIADWKGDEPLYVRRFAPAPLERKAE